MSRGWRIGRHRGRSVFTGFWQLECSKASEQGRLQYILR